MSTPLSITVEEHPGPHRELAWSFLEAEDSERLLDSYIDLGRVWVARTPDGEVVGHLQAVPREPETWEVTNTAVVAAARRAGVGRALLDRAATEARASGVRRLVLATAAADVGALRYYQRCGFRMTHVVRDAFTSYHGYPDDLVVDGIPMRDQVWFEQLL